MSERWIRAGTAHVVEHRDRLLLVGDDGSVRVVTGASAAVIEVALAALAVPGDRAAVAAALADAFDGAPAPTLVDDTLALLAAVGAIVAAPAPAPRAPRVGPAVRVVLGLSGSVGAIAAPALVLALQRRGCEVQVVATRAALRFAPITGLEALTHRRVVRSLWSRDPAQPVPHLALAAWADLVLVCPASATTLARLAHGDHGCVLAATALCAQVPVVIAPSMNPAMLAEPAVQRNLAQLRDDGCYVVPPGDGVEVAEDPGARTGNRGGAPPPERMAALALAIHAAAGAAPAARAIDWQALHAAVPAGVDGDPDDELWAVIDRHAAPPGLLLDVGTGLGPVARAASDRGFAVVATDLAPAALAHARAAAGPRPITWLEDDVTASKLHGGFAVIVDRGCLHFLDVRAAVAWAATIVRLLAPGGVVVVKLDAAAAPAARATRRLDAAALAALLAPACALVEAVAGSFPSAAGPVPATTVVLRRRG
ncbi:MAG: methyltransferase domain-containing protein [Myxococcales bacterium]|nr:methyltransferase domain-containing protein [Myxococcales bacterium]